MPQDPGQDGGLRGARLKPHVDDVHLLTECGFAAVRAAGSGRDDFRGGTRVPGVGALALKEVDDRPVRGLIFSSLPQPSQKKTAIGTPQMRWHEMHQSGRVATMFEMRSSPQAGSQRTPAIALRASVRRVPSSITPSMEMNHCSVARKMTGL